MNPANVLLPDDADVRPWSLMECKITVSATDAAGGDFERNDGGMRKDRRVTFDGFATKEVLEALVDMCKEVLQP